MAVRGAIACAVLLAACGRIGFSSAGDDVASDAAPGDGTVGDIGPLLDCTQTYPGALLCSGFETASMAPWDYDIIVQGSVNLSTTRAYRGASSLEIQTAGTDAYKYARWGKNDVLNAVASGDIYIRAYYWLESATMVTDQLSILVVGNRADPFPSTNVMLKPGEIHGNVDGTVTVAPFEFPRDRWTCLVLHIRVGVAGSLDVAVDGVSALSRTNFDTRVGGGYTNVDIGVHYATPTQAASHFWLDEVVVDTTPVTCN